MRSRPQPAMAMRQTPQSTASPNDTAGAPSTRRAGTSPPAATRTGPSRPAGPAPRRARGERPDGAEPVLGVRAAPGVGVVVRQVRADLDEDRAEQREHERQGPEDATGAGERRPDEDGSHGRGQRPRPRGHEPDLQGRRGNWEKSGGRLAL